MSRLGKLPIELPKGIEVSKKGNEVTVKGPKGTLTLNLKDGITIEVKENQLAVIMDEKTKVEKAFHGLYRSLINNMVVGIDKGFEKKLSLIGVGYRAAVKGKILELLIGYSFPINMNIPEGINIKIDKQGTEIVVSGIDKQKVGQFAAEVRSKRPPEPYKGKGIRYIDEYVRKKAGKAAKGGQ
jgi:large subunit ribosomal protein L6